MKKTLIAGAASVALAAMPVLGVFADTTLTDDFTITIADNCAFTNKTGNEHTAKTTATAQEAVIADGAWGPNSYTGTVLNGKQYDNFATSTFNVVCNNEKGYQVTVATSGFASATLQNEASWAYAKAGLSDTDVSSWTLVSNHADRDKNATAEIVAKETAATAGTDFTITYSMKVSTTQQAANDYKASAAYTFAQLQ